jgi:hypothetical protein
VVVSVLHTPAEAGCEPRNIPAMTSSAVSATVVAVEKLDVLNCPFMVSILFDSLDRRFMVSTAYRASFEARMKLPSAMS